MSLDAAARYPGLTWLLPGRYEGDLSLTTPNLILKSADGGGAIIEGNVDVWGAGIELWNLEFCYSGWTSRTSAQTGSPVSDLPQPALSVYGERTRVVNCIIHDLAGIAWWGPAIDSEFYGCIMYSIGWQGPDRGHGHGMYTQNHPGGRKAWRNCITWGHYATCGKVYSATSAPLKHYDISGLICGPSGDSRLLIGSEDGSTEDVTVQDCMTYGAAVHFGDALVTSSIAFDHLYVAHDTDIPLVMAFFNTLSGMDNTIVGGNGGDPSYRVVCKVASPGAWQLDRNTYHYTGPNAHEFRDEGVSDYTLAEWQAATGFDMNSTLVHGQPTANKIVVQPNAYDANRCHVAVWNWEGLASVVAPIAGRYTNAQNPAESVVLAEGDPLPMQNWTVATPIGAAAPLATFDPRFAVFLVTA